MRSPFTGVVFAVELTHDLNAILPLLLASVIAHAFTVLSLRRCHPDGEGGAPRLSPEPGIRGRSAGDLIRAGGNAAEHCRLAG